MWWLLIPVVGAVVTAIVSSDSDDSSSSSSGSSVSRETAEREAREKEQQRLRRAKQNEIVAETRSGLEHLYHSHSDMVVRRNPHQWTVLTFNSLEEYVREFDSDRSSFFHLKKLLPDTEFANTFSQELASVASLHDEIAELIALGQQLDEEAV
ncbi:hypothetical protein WCU79_20030 [Pectobacterium versatile]|uniref:Uncharacterized protein n=1 Tax=Pectobacterium versatile TaxID=2488639 RepID=A0ABU8K407_9GAMM|nr:MULTISPECIES: hypothetical protein [Pectobacterium]MBN3196693.1 hypothetical protein [Pectobacterium versatile]TAI92960.1 hypothetical protein EG335_21815 [Pectobacterium versatile]UCP83151.1 hypothetical protein LGL95_07810 [Pectobacterium versatile]ULS47312.1 hypothetical protein F9W95_17810 [Pectobacterium carotovorum]